jgi:tRNA1(Val) A37 N6-methylase TrmN6
MTAAADAPAAPNTVDAFLGGKVEVVQRRIGHHRAGLEAVLLSAAIEPDFAGTVVDLGAGVGVAGMAIAARCPDANVILVERDAEAIACCREALVRPANSGFAAHISVVVTDIASPESERIGAGLGRAIANAVVMNPPFHEAEVGTTSPDHARAAAHVLTDAGLEPWLRAAASVLKPDGRLVIVFRADGLDAVLTALAGRFGSAAILPIHPRAGLPARRVLVDAVLGSRGPLRILPGLALHQEGASTYLPAMEQILRHGVSLSEAHPAWAKRGH